jgi:hypothetical protein
MEEYLCIVPNSLSFAMGEVPTFFIFASNCTISLERSDHH